jgi:hypothetical protein
MIYLNIIIKLTSCIFFASFILSANNLTSYVQLKSVSENGFNITSIKAELKNENFSAYKSFIISEGNAVLNISNVPDGEYKFTISVFSDSEKLAEKTSNIFVKAGLSLFPVFLNSSCSKLYLTIQTRPKDYSADNLPYNFVIDSTDLRFHRHEINNAPQLAEIYYQNKLPYVIPMNISWHLLDSGRVPLAPSEFGPYRNPVTVSHTALAFFQQYYLTGLEYYKEWFLNNIDWLMHNHNENFYYTYPVDVSHSSQPLASGWVSGMAQGEALKVISRAYYLTGDPVYLEKAQNIFKTLYKNSASNWVIFIDNRDYYWIEEYPNPDFCNVLNGKLSALLGIWDYYAITRSNFALNLFEGGLTSIIDNFPNYVLEGENASRYCRHFTRSFWDYHVIHTVFTKKIGQVYNISDLVELSNCFAHDAGVKLSEPADGTPVLDMPLKFKWRYMNHTDRYSFQLSNDSTFNNIIVETSVADTFVIVNYALPEDNYFWRVKSIKLNSNSGWSQKWSFGRSDVNDIEGNGKSFNYFLFDNFPNPFNPSTTISYALKETNHTSLEIFDILGNKIDTLIDEIKEPGFYTLRYDSKEIASGVYFYSIKSGDFFSTKKMIITR